MAYKVLKDEQLNEPEVVWLMLLLLVIVCCQNEYKDFFF